jgi:hypothetical protein
LTQLTLAYVKDPKNGYTYLNNKWFKTNLIVGDKVKRITRASSSYSAMKPGDEASVIHVDNSGYRTSDYFYEPNSLTQRNDYCYVYEQRIKIDKSNQTYNGSNFIKIGGNNMLALDVDRPTFVREFIEKTEDGKVVREYIGDYLPFDNVNAAQVYCTNQISDAIRQTNTYRKFSIVVEKAVAQAKKPEIEFA